MSPHFFTVGIIWKKRDINDAGSVRQGKHGLNLYVLSNLNTVKKYLFHPIRLLDSLAEALVCNFSDSIMGGISG